MSETEPVQPARLPKAAGETVEFIGGSSGNPARVTRVDETTLTVELPAHPDYRATLIQTGTASFDLNPAPGVFAVGGTGLTWDDILNNF